MIRRTTIISNSVGVGLLLIDRPGGNVSGTVYICQLFDVSKISGTIDRHLSYLP